MATGNDIVFHTSAGVDIERDRLEPLVMCEDTEMVAFGAADAVSSMLSMTLVVWLNLSATFRRVGVLVRTRELPKASDILCSGRRAAW